MYPNNIHIILFPKDICETSYILIIEKNFCKGALKVGVGNDFFFGMNFLQLFRIVKTYVPNILFFGIYKKRIACQW